MTDSLTYLKDVLGLDANEHAGLILERRREHRRDTKSATAKSHVSAPVADRASVESALAEIAEELFDSDARELAMRLKALETEAFPDLRRKAKRLSAVVAARGEIDRAREHADTAEFFFRAVLKILAVPQRKSIDHKRRLLDKMKKAALRKAAHKSLRTWKHAFPALYALEEEWFTQVMKAKSVFKLRKKPVTFGFFAIYVILRIIRAVTENG